MFYFFVIVGFYLLLCAFGYIGVFHGEFMAKTVVVAVISEPAAVILVSIALCIKIRRMNQSLSYSQNFSFNNMKIQSWLIFEFQVIVATVILIVIITLRKSPENVRSENFYYITTSGRSYDFMILFDIITCYSAALILIFAIDFKVNGMILFGNQKRQYELSRTTQQNTELPMLDTSIP
jgi:hypothetical protein